MELAAIDNSRIIYLTLVNRDGGPAYLPEVISKIGERYSFAKLPQVDDLTKEVQTFSIGKFQDIQISELGIYNDGLIIASRSDTKYLDAFIDDLFSWAKKELGVSQSVLAKPEKYYESTIIIKSTQDLAKKVSAVADVENIFNKAFFSSEVPERNIKYGLSGAVYDCDAFEYKGKRKPFRFLIERRTGFPYKDNIFFSQAPLPTSDHMKVLKEIEELMQRRL